jgi:hypothetical protein
VYDKSAFLSWYSKVSVPQNHQNSNTKLLNSTYYIKNYYYPISDKNTNNPQEVDTTSPTKIVEETRTRVKKDNKNWCNTNTKDTSIIKTNMPEVQHPQYNIPDISVTEKELLNRINGPMQDEENWKMVNQKGN